MRAGLSAAFTVLCAVIVVGFVGFVVWLHVTSSVLDSVVDPERALDLVVGRTLDLHEAMEAVPAWERRFYQLGVADSGEDLPHAIEWYDELARVSLDPGVDLRLAILRAENDDVDDVERMVASWPARGAPFDRYAALVNVAYLDGGPLEAAPPPESALSPGWFLDHVRLRLAERLGDGARAAAARRAETARGAELLTRARALVILTAAAFLGGVICTVDLARRRRAGVATAPRPPLWRGRDGFVVLIRGGAGAAVLTLALIPAGPWIGSDSAVLEALGIPLMNVPLLWLARRRLLAPAGQSFRSALGLMPAPGRFTALARAVFVLVGAGIVIDIIVGALGDWLHLSAHWTEWFDADLAWGSPAAVAASLFSTIVLAPVFEEIAFRGLLYGTLRRGLAWPAAATLSAAVFAVAHGYGAAGFISVFLSGTLWAMAYEVTGSLLPGIVAHAANNVSASLAVLWLLR